MKFEIKHRWTGELPLLKEDLKIWTLKTKEIG